MMESPDVRNIKADLEAADEREESKKDFSKKESGEQILSQRS